MALRILCPTPDAHCTGAFTQLTKMLGTAKTHTSHEDCYKCYVRYLKSIGYKPVDSAHCFAPPDDSPALMLGRPSQFGGELRPGKQEKTAKGRRWMPKQRTSGGIY